MMLKLYNLLFNYSSNISKEKEKNFPVIGNCQNNLFINLLLLIEIIKLSSEIRLNNFPSSV